MAKRCYVALSRSYGPRDKRTRKHLDEVRGEEKQGQEVITRESEETAPLAFAERNGVVTAFKGHLDVLPLFQMSRLGPGGANRESWLLLDFGLPYSALPSDAETWETVWGRLYPGGSCPGVS